ncbi:glycosyltransferase family 2 protein [Aetokthonos hydrillicola Thurmond2011]|jgi:glycosyltransferase involved in cell wall biosynthesis|uniref:Glycosyltransferase family 2 protein n=1 Tax=Aetokthonos hydrillicola Thurmond2011 TaxID=2712845 RepID=A0AAP5M7D3_9CYAN|nr:glycosyltransferase family 2 protein [Aetokthonos hydrillicola]MBO3460295.1 glycosyltransferase family 2 protein [Aetokthonos hydrillicola CCALA 1050]MBW4587607.1 glycosyltransferase family 2 protein [Aetokthonos hydrillicola CCALA 1050]MDR9898011.1 glycosyltransferase family 2 protein [Aetokthonos hydrillicola Thurmond2011]
MQLPISSIILTKNEISNIKRCIESLQWCQEVIVVDSGSTDGTQQLAESLKAKVFTHTQPPPFKISEQRNWALQNCNLQGEWVLFVDADETIPPDLATEIQHICLKSDSRYNAFELPARYIFWGKWLKRTQGYPNWHCRLLKVGQVNFLGGVWEQFTPDAKVGKINTPYDHFANSKGFTDWLERHDRYSSWDAQKVVEFLETGKAASLETERKLRLRLLAARFWFVRPIFRFLQMYFLRLGFLEGPTALVFCLLYAMYEFMTVVKIIELKRYKSGLPL